MRKRNIKSLICFPAAVLGGMAAINKMICSESDKGMLCTQKGSYYHSSYGRIYYEQTGNGSSVLLLLHNVSPADSSCEWNPLIEELKENYQIYCLDLPGCGRSDHPSIEYTNYFYAQVINQFVQDVIGIPLHLCASNDSAAIAVSAAMLCPSTYHKLTLIHPASLKKNRTQLSEFAHAIRFLFGIPVIGCTLYNMTQSRSSMEFRRKEKDFYNPFQVPKSAEDVLYEAAHMDNGRGRYLLASQKAGYLNWDIRRALSALKLPLTILYGKADEKEEKIVSEYRKINAQVTVRAIEHTKRYPHLENPKTVSTWI